MSALPQDLVLRPEAVGDEAAIHALTERAFRGRPYAGGDEQDVIDRLRDVGALELSLVAVLNGEIVGHIAFSPADCRDGSGPWFALGPVSVEPEHQGKGIGGALIRAGLEQIEAGGALGCILTGSTDYYPRFGFVLAPEQVPDNEPAEHFMLKTFGRGEPAGTFAFHRAFYGAV